MTKRKKATSLNSINAFLGRDKLNICERCESKRPPEELNYEAKIHHGAHKLECIDRKACGKRKKK